MKFNKDIEIEIDKETKLMVVSDIHLQLPKSNELQIIERSLSSRINELSKYPKAILVLNGDVLELWENPNQAISDIMSGFRELTEAIEKFANKKSHKVFYTAGNHDDIISKSAADRADIISIWKAQVCRTLDVKINGKVIRIEHGHEIDPYNRTSETEDPSGKRMVQKSLPVLIKSLPSLFNNVGDVVNRSLIPTYLISNLAYKIIFPIVLPITLFISMFLTIYTNDRRYTIAVVYVIVAVWLFVVLADLIIRFIAEYSLGGGSPFMKRTDKYAADSKINYLVFGHTHQGKIEKRGRYVYSNSGCNDIVAFPRFGFLGIYKFDRYIQLSNIDIDFGKKHPIKYHQQFIPLVK